MSKLAREKQDAEQFIRQIAPEYLGVYVVDRETDEFRDILAPEYFRWNAAEMGAVSLRLWRIISLLWLACVTMIWWRRCWTMRGYTSN